MISTDFTYLKDFLYETKSDIGSVEILDDLLDESFQDTDVAYGLQTFSLRTEVKHIRSPRLQQICEHFAGNVFKKMIWFG